MDDLEERVRDLGPWRQDIDLGPFSTFDVIEDPQGVWNAPGQMNERWGPTGVYLADPPGRALDVGCNAGYLSFRLEDAGFDVFGIDRGEDPELEAINDKCREFVHGDRDELPPEDDWLVEGDPIEQAHFCRDARNSGADFAYADALSLPIADDAVDVVLAYGLIYHLHEPFDDSRRREIEEYFIDECFRVATRQVLLEMPEEHPPRDPTWDYHWVPWYITDSGHSVDVVESGDPPGLRYVVVAEPV